MPYSKDMDFETSSTTYLEMLSMFALEKIVYRNCLPVNMLSTVAQTYPLEAT